MVHDGLIYAVTRGNRLSIIDAADGTVVHERKLTELGRSEHNIYASITFAGGYLFITNVRGKTLVLRPGRNPEIVAAAYQSEAGHAVTVWNPTDQPQALSIAWAGKKLKLVEAPGRELPLANGAAELPPDEVAVMVFS